MATLEDVTTLIGRATRPKELAALKRQRAQLLRQIGVLIETNLRQGSEEYAAATQALQDASTGLRAALRRLEMTAEAIATLGRALDLVAKLVV
jgi:hypothetical protein